MGDERRPSHGHGRPSRGYRHPSDRADIDRRTDELIVRLIRLRDDIREARRQLEANNDE